MVWTPKSQPSETLKTSAVINDDGSKNMGCSRGFSRQVVKQTLLLLPFGLEKGINILPCACRHDLNIHLGNQAAKSAGTVLLQWLSC